MLTASSSGDFLDQPAESRSELLGDDGFDQEGVGTRPPGEKDVGAPIEEEDGWRPRHLAHPRSVEERPHYCHPPHRADLHVDDDRVGLVLFDAFDHPVGI